MGTQAWFSRKLTKQKKKARAFCGFLYGRSPRSERVTGFLRQQPGEIVTLIRFLRDVIKFEVTFMLNDVRMIPMSCTSSRDR